MTPTTPRLTRTNPGGIVLGALRALVRNALVAPPAVEPRPDAPAATPMADRETAQSGQAPSSWRWRLAVPWHRVGLIGVLLLSVLLNLYRLDREGNGNLYYTAAVYSMLHSWHAFFFASFDPGSFVSVDKPPLGFWIQAASAKLLGLFGVPYSGPSVILPEALAGVASVAIVYQLVRRGAGPVAGLLAALALAVTPVSVAISRNNTIDSSLVLVLLLAVWAAFRAAERGSLGWLLASATLVGLGFEIKMLQAYLVAPAIYLLYLVAAPRARLIRIGHLALASVALLVVSLAWPVAVDLTPTDQRPYVGSTQDNSAVSLAFGYNGLERLFGHGMTLQRVVDRLRAQAADDASPADGETRAQPGGAVLGPAGDGSPATGPVGPGARGSFGGPGGPGGQGGPGGIGENGPPGPLRLVNQQLGAQASWLLPLALVGMLVSGWSAWTHRRALASDRRAQALLLWGTWLVTAAGFFSVAGYFHSYYLVMLGPPLAALAAIGVQGCWEAYTQSRRLAVLLPLALIGTAGLQAYLLLSYPAWAESLTPLVMVGVGLTALVLLGLRLARQAFPDGSRRVLAARLAAGLGVLVLLMVPAIWAGHPAVLGQVVGGLPSAGPRAARAGFGGPGFPGPGIAGPGGGPFGRPGGPPAGAGFGAGQPDGARANGPVGRAPGRPARPGGFGGPGGFTGPGGQGGPGTPGGPNDPGNPGGTVSRADQIAYLRAHRGSTSFLAATSSANQAAPIILETGQPVMALGGFLGSDPILTVDGLIARVQANEVRYFLVDGRGGFGGPGGRNELTSWVQVTCQAIPPSAIVAAPEPGTDGYPSGLYDCGNLQVSTP